MKTTDFHKAAIVDLDGTYINGNTLKIYTFCGIQYCLKNLRLLQLTKIISILVKRRLRLISHVKMKKVILSEFINNHDISESFVAEAKKQINPAVKDLLSKLEQKGYTILLATAAPDFYVRDIWDGEFVATHFDNSTLMIECRCNEKLSRVNQWLISHNCELNMVITDHTDDAPLFEANKNGINILVNPSRKTLRFFRKLKPTHFLLIEDVDNLSIPC